MTELFSADDVFQAALRMENNGAEFYRRAASKVTSARADIKNLFNKLAAMEDAHTQTFAKLHRELNENENKQTKFGPKDESLLHLKVLVDVGVFFKKKVNLSSLKEVFKAAIEAERDSIVFYLSMREMVPETGKNRIDLIIKEEMKHIHLLGKELTAIKHDSDSSI